MFPGLLTDLRLADTWCYSPAGLPPVSTPSCRADLSRHFLGSPLSLLTPVQPHPGNAVFCGELSEAISSYLDLSGVCFFWPPSSGHHPLVAPTCRDETKWRRKSEHPIIPIFHRSNRAAPTRRDRRKPLGR